ncbi:MAG: type IV pilin protein [Pseudomonadota bacterium]
MALTFFKNQSAFSLVEIMIVIAIIGIIASWAIPSYQQSILTSHRSDAKSGLLKLQLEQEKWRAAHSAYAILDELQINTITENGYYHLTIEENPDSDQFFAVARPMGSQKKDHCGSFAINQFGAVYEKFANARCWGE